MPTKKKKKINENNNNNQQSYQALSSTCTQSQPCTATLISSFVQCQISFQLCLRQSPRLF